MGRQPYLTRLALGRSAYEHPEDSEDFNASRAGEWSSALAHTGLPHGASSHVAESRPPQGVQLYDARGHGINPWSRRLGRRLREAMNDVLSVVGVVERSKPDFFQDGLEPHNDNDLVNTSTDEDETGVQISTAAVLDYEILSSWHTAFVSRLLAFPPLPGSSYIELIKTHCTAMGLNGFFFAGMPNFLLSMVYTPEAWSADMLYHLDRAVLATVSSRANRDFYGHLIPFIHFGVRILWNTFLFPFDLHSNLQSLGFIPVTSPFPPLRSWIPFCGTSVLQFHRDHLQILPFILARPLGTFVFDYITTCSRMALMVPLNVDSRRRSSSSRRTMSVGSVSLLEMSNLPFLGPFHKLFGFLGWGHSAYIPQTTTSTPWGPGLQRRETWPADVDHDIPQLGGAADSFTTALEHQNSTEEVGRQEAPESERPPLHHAPSSSNDNEVDIDAPGLETNATIRVASIDPSGTINLEIGFAEVTETLTDEALMNAGRSRHGSASRDGLAIPRRPHHISELTHEPTNMLAFLFGEWATGIILMPVRALVLSKLAKHVITRPDIYGVDAARARSLPHALGSVTGLSAFTSGGIDGYGGKFALACVVDASLGLGFWLAEWALVRWIGKEFYNWGKF